MQDLTFIPICRSGGLVLAMARFTVSRAGPGPARTASRMLRYPMLLLRCMLRYTRSTCYLHHAQISLQTQSNGHSSERPLFAMEAALTPLRQGWRLRDIGVMAKRGSRCVCAASFDLLGTAAQGSDAAYLRRTL